MNPLDEVQPGRRRLLAGEQDGLDHPHLRHDHRKAIGVGVEEYDRAGLVRWNKRHEQKNRDVTAVRESSGLADIYA